MKVHGLVDSSMSVFVGPLEGQGRFIVMADVAHDFAMEIALGVENATGDEIPLDFREPDLSATLFPAESSNASDAAALLANLYWFSVNWKNLGWQVMSECWVCYV